MMMKKIFTALFWVCNLMVYGVDTFDDPCASAHPMSCGEDAFSDNISGYNYFTGQDYGTHANGYGYGGIDKIYKIRKASRSDRMNIHLYTEVKDMNIFLVESCWDGKVTCIASGRDMPGGKYIEDVNGGMPAGEYFIIVDGKEHSDKGAYTLSVSCKDLDCTTAQYITCGQTLSAMSNAGYQNNVSIYGCDGDKWMNYTGKERIFQFALSKREKIKIELNGIGKILNFD